jgi:hypothetical protein
MSKTIFSVTLPPERLNTSRPLQTYQPSDLSQTRKTIVRSVANPYYSDNLGLSPYGPNSMQESYYHMGLSVMGIIRELDIEEEEIHPLDFVPDAAHTPLYGPHALHTTKTFTTIIPTFRKILYPNSNKIRRCVTLSKQIPALCTHPISSTADLLTLNQVPFNPALSTIPSRLDDDEHLTTLPFISRRPSWVDDLLPLSRETLPRIYNEYSPDADGFLTLTREATAVHPLALTSPSPPQPNFQVTFTCRLLNIPQPPPQ